MLKNLLNTKVVQVVEQVKDWREAVAISCRPLIENGSIEPRYVDAIYHSHDTIGP
ncbi:PTS sugar transporter subunit IIA, partial [Escherichia coli]